MDEVELFQICLRAVVIASADVRGDALALEAHREVADRFNDCVVANRVLALSPGTFDPLSEDERARILESAFKHAVSLVAVILDDREIDDDGLPAPSCEQIQALLSKELAELELQTAQRMADDRAEWERTGEEAPEFYY